MKKILLCGHLDLKANKETTSGQIIKTRIIKDELANEFSSNQISTIDTHGGHFSIFRIVFQSFVLLPFHRDIILMPAYKGITVLVPLFVIMNLICRKRIHIVAIGGWLDSFVKRHTLVCFFLRKAKCIYVETNRLKDHLDQMHFKNVVIMKNFKRLPTVPYNETSKKDDYPLKLCTFSRVMKEKGIEDAIHAVRRINDKSDKTIYSLDIYGEIDKKYKERFRTVLEKSPEYISYKGIVHYDQSVQTLKEYFALLFPTYYSGEGMPGTLIDAMAAGVPVVSSDWKDNAEIIKNDVNGILFPAHDTEALVRTLVIIQNKKEEWNKLRETARKEYEKYTPETALSVLLSYLKAS